MGSGPLISGKLHRNDWFRDWLVEHEIGDESAVQKAVRNPAVFANLVERAQSQQVQPAEDLNGRSIVAGRSLDLTEYLACGHADCITRQVDELFSRVWHYFDKIAISGPDAHRFLHSIKGMSGNDLANWVPQLARPVFHLRDLGADGLVSWVSKPPACPIHWKEFESLDSYHLADEFSSGIAQRLLDEGTTRFSKLNGKPGLVLYHPDLFNGKMWWSIDTLNEWKSEGESPEETMARWIVAEYWAGAASDLITANSMALPLGLGISLEAKMASLRRGSFTPSEVAFNLVLPVVDGLPLKELMVLREAEQDAFEGFRDSLTAAIKERISIADPAVDEVTDLAVELQADVIDPALHHIQRRLHAAEGLLQKNHRYNVAIAGLATVCGLLTSPDITAAVAVAAMAGVATVESKFNSEKKDISLEDMYFLWKAKEYAESNKNSTNKPRRKRKR
jgi:hypothetical protein